jgi:DNA polymerase IV
MFLDAQRHITHLDLDQFFVSVEYLRNPKLKGKPILIGGLSNRGVVASCSYEARKFGIHSGMPMRNALRLCRHATVIKSDFEAYSQYSQMVTEIIKENAPPQFEKSSIDEFYIDMTGMEKHFGSLKFSDNLKKKISKESGLSISYALSSNKTVSKVATNEVKPNGQIEIPFGNEKGFLAPLSITKIPGIGKERGFKLLKMGVETVKTFTEIPVKMVYNLFGKDGITLHRKANGIDNSPVTPFREQKALSTETTFQTDTIDTYFIYRKLVRMTEKLAFDLRKHNRLTGCVTVKIRYSDFVTETKQQTLRVYANQDHILLQKAKELFGKLYNRRQLIRLVGVRFTDLIPGVYQIHLYDDTQELINYYRAVDSVKNRFGEDLLTRAAGYEPKPHESVVRNLLKSSIFKTPH